MNRARPDRPNAAEKIYRRLFAHFGPQGWWPTTPKGKLKPVYYPKLKNRRLSSREKFEICVGAILTQNTAWTNVMKALHQLHVHKMMDPRRMLRCPPTKLAQLIRSSGYFRQKAQKLRIFSEYLLDKYEGDTGKMLGQPWKPLREELLELWGIGPETADSMLLYAGGHPVFVVDAYTRRAGNRIGLFKSDSYDEIQRYFEQSLSRSPQLYNEYHALIVELAKNTCKTKPQCPQCPLLSQCRQIPD